jgi:hypothetical protein
MKSMGLGDWREKGELSCLLRRSLGHVGCYQLRQRTSYRIEIQHQDLPVDTA